MAAVLLKLFGCAVESFTDGISSRFFENEPNEICGHLRVKGPKGRFLASDNLKSHISKGKSEEEERKRNETAMATFLVFIWATLWQWFDRRGLFNGNVFKNPDIFSSLMRSEADNV